MAVVQDMADAASLPYHEPNIAQILVMASFLVVLNGVNAVIDRLLYCGLIGQVFIGIAWGTPGAQWLASTLSASTAAFEHVVVQLGYLGLILLVYEGGVSTSIASLKANLLLAVTIATTGIAAPMALSFVLGPLVSATPIQCFAAGAALCSTSLGTTFTVLSTSGLSSTRLGSVLSTAAMMDDVVGLVMVQIVSSLGSAGGDNAGSSVSIEPATVLRPVLVSIAFAVVIPLANRFLLRPAMQYLDNKEDEVSMQHGQQDDLRHKKTRAVFGILATREGALVIHTALLLGLVAAAAYAGASVLLAAYLAGIMVCWWDAERETRWEAKRAVSAENSIATESNQDHQASPATGHTTGPHKSEHTGVAIYAHYYEAAVSRILKPFFFASIGFSIPITKMFSGPIVWRGLIYTCLMLIGKVLCGLWLVRLPKRSTTGTGQGKSSASSRIKVFFVTRLSRMAAMVSSRGKTSKTSNIPAAADPSPSSAVDPAMHSSEANDAPARDANDDTTPSLQAATTAITATPSASSKQVTPAKPVSLYPAGIISFAMVARGEIGFLISAVAESKGIFSPSAGSASSSSSPSSSSDEPSDIFLIVTWAIVLCTIIGPLAVGVLVKRVRKLEAQRRGRDGGGEVSGGAATRGGGKESHEDHVLGAWGV